MGAGADGVTEVKVNSHIRDVRITKVDTGLYDVTMNLIVRQLWNDHRLAYDASHHPGYKYFHLTYPTIKNIWTSDLFFRKELKSYFHTALAPNALVWLYPDGNITYSLRISITLPCTQPEEKDDERKELVCPFDLASYGHTNDQVHFKWDEDPIKVSEHVFISHYTVGEITHGESASTSRIGTFSGVTAKIHFVPK